MKGEIKCDVTNEIGYKMARNNTCTLTIKKTLVVEVYLSTYSTRCTSN